MRHWHEPRMIQPRHVNPPGGVDHGAQGAILAELRVGNEVRKRLVWIAGHSTAQCGIRGFGRVYREASLAIVNGSGYSEAHPAVSGGRLTKGRLMAVSRQIDGAFGAGVTALIEIGRTLVIVDDGDGHR